MEKQPRHRPVRRFAGAERKVIECEWEYCVHCGEPLQPRKPWHMRKWVQTLDGPLFVAGKSKGCANPRCSHCGTHYYASGVLLISLPYSTYGLDVLAFIGWQHEQEHKQLVEIQRELNRRGVLVNERTVGKLYRQFLALLGGLDRQKEERLAAAAKEHGGLIWALDALQPEGHGTLLYVLYEVLSQTVVSARQLDQAIEEQVTAWLQPYRALPYTALATLSDGEKALVAGMERCWPGVPHQLCQSHFLNNLAEPVLEVDARLRQQMREDLGGLAAVPNRKEEDEMPGGSGRANDSPLL